MSRFARVPVRSLLVAALNHEAVSWPDTPDPVFPARVLEEARTEGVLPLLDYARRNSQALVHWPAALCRAIADRGHADAAVHLACDAELRRVLTALDAAGVVPLLMKGAALAYTHYPAPHLRPRADTDCLVHPADAAAATRALQALGYRRIPLITGDLIMQQEAFRRVDDTGTVHVVDAHLSLNNVTYYGRTFRLAELAEHAIPLPAVGPSARALSPVHALLLACMHRVGHRPEGNHDRLIWLYDIALLARRFETAEWEKLVRLAAERGVTATCLEGLLAAESAFPTRAPTAVLAELAASETPREAVVRRLGMSPWRDRIRELRLLPTWSERARLLKQWLVPPAEYVMSKYDSRSMFLLPALYVRRAVTGAWRQRSYRRPHRACSTRFDP
jgi:hypothetical protein